MRAYTHHHKCMGVNNCMLITGVTPHQGRVTESTLGELPPIAGEDSDAALLVGVMDDDVASGGEREEVGKGPVVD